MSLGWQAGAFVASTAAAAAAAAAVTAVVAAFHVAMLHDVPLLEADRQTLRSKGPLLQHGSAKCADLAFAHHNNGYKLTTIMGICLPQ